MSDLPSDKTVRSLRGKQAAIPSCETVKSRLERKKRPQSKAANVPATPPCEAVRTRQGRRKKASQQPAGNQEDETRQEEDEVRQEEHVDAAEEDVPSTATKAKAYLHYANRQGARCLVLEDYRYVRNKTRNGVMYWRCTQAGCCVYLKTNLFDVHGDSEPHIKVLHQTGRHRHLAKTNQLSRTALIEHMLQLVEADPTRPTKRIYDQVLASAAEEDVASVPSFDSVRSRLERRRTSLRPQLPDDSQQVPVTVETWNGDNFLSEHHGDHGFLIFTTETNITRLAQCTQVYIDGWFGGCPRPFQQLVTVHGLYWEQPIAFVMVLMSGSTEEMYKAVLKHIQHRVQTLTGQQWCPEVVTADLEVALFRALRGELLGAQVVTCSYHFYQSLRSKIQELHLAGAYQSDVRVRRWVRRAMAVVFLPPAVVRQSFREAAGSEETAGLVGEHPALGDFIRYLEQTYLGEHALFPPHIWNAYGHRQDNTDNNHVEAFHQRWNSAIDSRNPSLWVFIRRLKDEQKQVEAQCVMVESGGAPSGQKRKWRQLEQRMQQLQSQQQSGDKTLEEYWDAVQTHMGNFE
ncbi:uncharacterized protein LOC134455401 [Engraulis encrasicolus]|uniref:uncharacterized protein LOC134455401 n=1 Tax=Engraulis encrasicolus TaxID=184585 RepID=UPI002FD16C24